MAGLAVQNFVSAAVGMAVLAAVIRGFASRGAAELGNFWQDLTRTLLYILLPLSLVGALILVSQGVIQTLSGSVTFDTLGGAEQTLALGPAASQIAIKQLGTNGGGFFNVNSSFPFENATTLSNFVEVLFILLIPAALTATFGRMVGNRRQGWALYAAMAVMLVVTIGVAYGAEQNGSPAQKSAEVATAAEDGSTGGNLEGKDQRFGIANSAMWAAITTAASNGSVNSSHDAYTGAGGTVPLVNMMTGEVIFGGVGSGLYGMLLFVLLARVHRRADGGPDARVPGKEGRGPRGQVRPDRDALPGAGRARVHGAGDRHQVGGAVDLQLRPAGLLRDPLRLHLAGQQQRLGLRRLHRLRAAERPGQRGRLRHHLRRSHGRRGHALRPLRAPAGGAGSGGLAGHEARLADRRRALSAPTPPPSSPF